MPVAIISAENDLTLAFVAVFVWPLWFELLITPMRIGAVSFYLEESETNNGTRPCLRHLFTLFYLVRSLCGRFFIYSIKSVPVMGFACLAQGFVEYGIRMTWSKRDIRFAKCLQRVFNLDEVIVSPAAPNQRAVRLTAGTGSAVIVELVPVPGPGAAVKEDAVAYEGALESYRMDVVVSETFVEFVAIFFAGFIKFFYKGVSILFLFGYKPNEDVGVEQTIFFIAFSTGSEMLSLIVYICQEGVDSVERKIQEVLSQSLKGRLIGFFTDFGVISVAFGVFKNGFFLRPQISNECPSEWESKYVRVYNLCDPACSGVQERNVIIKVLCDALRAG